MNFDEIRFPVYRNPDSCIDISDHRTAYLRSFEPNAAMETDVQRDHEENSLHLESGVGVAVVERRGRHFAAMVRSSKPDMGREAACFLMDCMEELRGELTVRAWCEREESPSMDVVSDDTRDPLVYLCWLAFRRLADAHGGET